MTKKYLANEIYTQTIDSSESAATDMLIKTGAGKTIVLDTPVYKDALMAFAFKGTADEAVIDTFIGGIKEYKFETNKVLYINNTEAPHDYKYGTGIEIHLHWAVKNALVENDKVKFSFEFAVANNRNGTNSMTIFCDPTNPTVFGTKTIEAEYVCPAGGIPAGTCLYLTLGTISDADMANVRIGCSLIGRLSRVAKSTGGTNPASGTVFVQNMGIHYQIDTLGSRTITGK